MEEMLAAQAAVREAAPAVVNRHRRAGVLTWALLHRIESELIASVAASRQHKKRVLDMLRSAWPNTYPEDERAVSFEGHDVVPFAFTVIEEAWHAA